MKRMVVFNEPHLRALPGQITPQFVREVALPLKIQAMSRAITACTDLSQLLEYKSTADALAAAVRTVKHVVPEECARLNTVAKEALLRMGQLLNTYSNLAVNKPTKGHKGFNGSTPSPRGDISRRLHIPRHITVAATRLADSPADMIQSVLSDPKVTANIQKIIRHLPVRRQAPQAYSGAAREIFGSSTAGRYGLAQVASVLKRIPLSYVEKLTYSERTKARALVVECQEILDEIDLRLGPTKKE